MSPLISFIIPVYNADVYLSRCLNSLVKQTITDIELICVDDGSIDESPKICDLFASKDSRIRVVHQQNQGVSAARNKGIELTQGKYIAFVDADDWVDANVCEIFAESLKSKEYDLFCYSAVYHDKKKKESFLFGNDVELLSQKQKDELHCKVMTPSAPNYEYNCNTRFAGSVWGKFYRTELLKKNNLVFSTQMIISEDVLFNVFALDFFEKIGYTKKVFYHYQVGSMSAQNRYRRNSMIYFEFIIDKIQTWLLTTRKNKQYQECANSLFVHYLFGSLKEDYFHKDNPDKIRAKLELEYMLNQSKFQGILKSASAEYFSKSENVLIALMRKKVVLTISILLRIYSLFFKL